MQGGKIVQQARHQLSKKIYDDVENLKREVEKLKEKNAALEKCRNDLIQDMSDDLYIGEQTTINETFEGKRVCCLPVDLGVLPNAGTKTVETGLIMNTIEVIRFGGTAIDGAGNTFPLPNCPAPSCPVNSEYAISMYIKGDGNISITTGTDRSAYRGKALIYFIYK